MFMSMLTSVYMNLYYQLQNLRLDSSILHVVENVNIFVNVEIDIDIDVNE